MPRWTDAEPLPILREGDPALRRVARAVDLGDPTLGVDAARLCATLEAFRQARGFGRAIAAPQVGQDRRMIALDLGAGPWVMLNPEITWRSAERTSVWDDCMSIPDAVVKVKRHRSISLSFIDAKGRARSWERLPPDLAELLQHEIDHLDGRLMTDLVDDPEDRQPASRWAALVGAGRPTSRLSLQAIAEASQRIDPVFLNSPQYECPPLSEALGARVTVKVETLNPIRSFKGRGAGAYVQGLAAAGDRTPLVCASAGNFGQAMAWACRRHAIPLTVFAAESANPLKVERMRALGADVRLAGHDFDAAKDAARRHAAERRATMVEDGQQPPISEGAGTIAVELFRDDPLLDALLVPLGNGALIGGVARWAKAASPMTQIIGVYAVQAPSMALSFAAPRGAEVITTETAETLADGVAVRVPIPAAVGDMHDLVDAVLPVADETTLSAMALAHRHLGVVLEPAGAIALGALLAHRDRFEGQRVAVILTGGNLTDAQRAACLGASSP